MNERISRREFHKRGLSALLAGSAPLLMAQAKTREARTIRVGFIGVGGRGSHLLQQCISVCPEMQIPALCDINAEAANRAAATARNAGRGAPELYTDGDLAWEKMLARGDLDAVIVATPWRWHAPMALGAMKQGVVPAVEVPLAMEVDACWDIVRTSERTGVGCMMLENWSYRSDNLALLNMVRAGLFGRIVHVHCAHSHDCIDHWFFDRNTGADRWPAEYLVRYNRDQYPTHSVGPVLGWCDINCGDRFVTIASTATASQGINEYFRDKFGPEHPGAKRTYAQGDIVTSTLKTARGKTVIINYDMQLPRPYDNRWMLQGARGIYKEPDSIYLAGSSPQYHEWESFAPYHEQYRHKLFAQGGVGGHGGVDGIMLRDVLDAVRDRRPVPLDVYDSIVMSAIVGLSGQSIAQGSVPVEFPDFTGGRWETTKPKFAVDETVAARTRATEVTKSPDGLLVQTFLLGRAAPQSQLPDTALRLTGNPKAFAWAQATGDEPRHCLYSESDWGIEVTVPPGASGTVSVYAYAPDGQRRQTVTFGVRAPSALDDLTKGAWLDYPFTPADTKDGPLRLKVRKVAGANSVLSKVKIAIRPAG
jgi:hypothetical protein